MKHKTDNHYPVRVNDAMSNDIERIAFNTKRSKSEVLRELISIGLEEVYKKSL